MRKIAQGVPYKGPFRIASSGNATFWVEDSEGRQVQYDDGHSLWFLKLSLAEALRDDLNR